VSPLQAQVRAALQQVRASTPREGECDEWCAASYDQQATHSDACCSRWAQRVDARLAVCVEAMLSVGIREATLVALGPANDYASAWEAGLAAFLAAAAQKETT